MTTIKTAWVPLRAQVLKELSKTRKALTCHDLYALPQIKLCAASHSDVARALSQLYRTGENGIDRVPCGPNQPNCLYAYFSHVKTHDAAQDPIPHLDHEPVNTPREIFNAPVDSSPQGRLQLAPKKAAIRIKGNPDELDIRHRDNGDLLIETPRFAITIEA